MKYSLTMPTQVHGDNCINMPDASGMTAFLWACYYNRCGCDTNSYIAKASELLDYCRVDHLRKLKRNGADMQLRDMDEKTACQWAVSGPGLECLSAMLTRDEALATDRLGRTVLHYAAEQDATRTIKCILVVCPGVLSARDHSGRTALHYAGVCGSARAARTLLKRGADPMLADVEGRTALDYARQMQHGTVAALLGTYGAGGVLSVEEQQTCMQSSTGALTRIYRGGALMLSIEMALVDTLTQQGDPNSAILQLFHLLSMGSYLQKFTNHGKVREVC
jgi:ankyrin repeat protein